MDNQSIEDWLTRRSNRWNHGSDLSPLVLRVSSDFIMEREARPLGVKVVGDKSPNSLLDGVAVQQMHKVYPDGKPGLHRARWAGCGHFSSIPDLYRRAAAFE